MTNTIKNTCASCSISIVSIKNKDKKTSVIQSGGAIGDIPLIFTFTVTNSSPLTLVKETIQSAAQTSIQDPNQYCPAGELLDSTSVLCVSRVYVNMYTTNELNNTPDWVPPVAAIATAGVVGLALMGANKYLKSDTPVKPEAQAAGQIPTGYQHNTPILTEGEADLLNDLNLTPANMSEIFKADNEYAKKFNMTELKSWDTAISMFLGNLTTQSCYNNRLLLTRSECEKSKCFLYSIRDYLDNPVISGRIQAGMLMKDGSSEFNEPDIENDSEIVLAHDNMPMGQYLIHPDDNKPYVNVGAIEKRSNVRKHFQLKLSEETQNKVKDKRHPTDEEKERLNAKFKDLQIKYAAKYVMYLY